VQAIDCAVVGAGPAGLAASVALAGRGVDHLVLERDRVAGTWRSQRWDSFRLNTAGWMNTMFGDQARYAYAPGGEVVERLERIAAGCPVREGVRVARLAPAGDGWALATDDGELRARTVVVAAGDQNVPRVPALAGRLPGRVAQLHAAEYRGPAQLPEGTVRPVDDEGPHADHRPRARPEPAGARPGRRHPGRPPGDGGRRAGRLR